MPAQGVADPELLIGACQQAYRHYPHDCSHAVHEVLLAMLEGPVPYRVANDLMHFMAGAGSGWRRVATLTEAAELANRGFVVVGGLANPTGSGHVIVVMPGEMKPD